MRLMVALLVVGLAAMMSAGADVPAEKAYKEWADWSVGGTWSTTDAKGNKEDLRFEWILDKSFVLLTWKGGDESLHEIHGMDPATGKWTSWGFDNKGRVFKGSVVSEKAGEWAFQSSGQGNAGPIAYKDKTVKLAADTRRVEVLENVLDGKKLPLEVQTWTRSKEAGKASGPAASTTAKKDVTAAEKAFREIGDWSVGGTWTGASPEYKVEERWEWVLDRSFLQLQGKDNFGAWIEFHGIDPANGRWTLWGVDEKGRVWQGTMESPKASEWTYRIKGQGKAGPMIWNGKGIKLTDDSKRLELQEIVVDGKKGAVNVGDLDTKEIGRHEAMLARLRGLDAARTQGRCRARWLRTVQASNR